MAQAGAYYPLLNVLPAVVSRHANPENKPMADRINYKHELEVQTQIREQAEQLLELRSRELSASNEKLQHTVEELQTKNLAMVQQEKLASIGLLAAGIAHEINNPIGFVKSNLEVLKGYFHSIQRALQAYNALFTNLQESEQSSAIASEIEKLRHLLEVLDIDYITDDSFNSIEESLSGAVRVQEIVRDLKDFSRNDENDQRTKCDINVCIEGSINLVSSEVKQKCNIIRQFGDIPEVFCYMTQLTQVFINIIMNAVHAMETGGELEIRTDVEGKNIRVEFIDSGPGIDEDNLIKLFDPFFTTKAVGMGTGLGLYVSHGLIQKHKGAIWAENEPGKGAKIIITLPVDMRGDRTRRLD